MLILHAIMGYHFYETHKPINLYNFVDRYLFKKMTKNEKFYSLILTSSYLINDYNQYPYFAKNK